MHADPDPLQLRPARPRDLDALVALEAASFHGDRLSRRQYRHHLDNPRAGLLVAIDSDRLTGSMLLLFRRGSGVARLYSLAVDPAWRGRGIARRLLDAGEALARRRGCTRLRLEVRADNRAAQSLYEDLGYRRFAETSGYYADGATAWRYEKRLGA